MMQLTRLILPLDVFEAHPLGGGQQAVLYVSYLAWEHFKVPPDVCHREPDLDKQNDVQAYINTRRCTRKNRVSHGGVHTDGL